MGAKPTWAQIVVFFTLIVGIVCLVVAAITSAILAVGWMVHWLIPSLPFESASVVAGIALSIATFLLYRVVIFLSVHVFPPRFTYEDDDEEENDDDYESDEEMAERIAELTVAKLSRPPVQKKYTAKARRK